MKKYISAELTLAKTGDTQISLGEEDSNELVSYFLRASRGRRDLAEMVRGNSESQSFVAKLEEIRTLISNEDFELAKKEIDLCQPVSDVEKAELLLEECRYYFWTNRFETVLPLLQKLITSKDLITTTKITALEMLGQTHYSLGQFSQAEEHLTKSMDFLEFFPFARSAFVAGAHLIKLKSELKKFNEAQSVITFLEKKCKQVDQDETWLVRSLLLNRGKCHYFFHMGQMDERETCLLESFFIAEWVKDKLILRKCSQELADKTPSPDRNLNLLPLSGVLLIKNPRKVIRLAEHPVLVKIVALLLQGAQTSEQVFEKVWELKFDKERHDQHLRSTLSKLRKKLPPDTLVVKDGKIYLQ